MAHRNNFRRNNLQISNWQHIQRLKITILGANWQLFRLERIAKWSTQIIQVLLICSENTEISVANLMIGLFPLGNKYFGVFALNGLKALFSNVFSFHFKQSELHVLTSYQCL